MTKLLISILFIGMLLISGCTPTEYHKDKGVVINKYVSGGRYGDSYYVKVEYPVDGGKVAIGEVEVGNASVMDSYKVGEKVTVYINPSDSSLGEIAK